MTLKILYSLVLTYQFIEADHYERNALRKDYRNGYYEREYMLNIGRINSKVPRTRSGEFSTEVFERYERVDRAFVLAMVEMVVQGVSTRKVTEVVEQLCGESVSKSFVSDIAKKLDPIIQEFKQRSLTKTAYRYVYVDAMYVKVRENNRVISKAVYIAQGVNDDNGREIIGFTVSEEESEEAWSNFFVEMINRGLTRPKMIISDAHAGLKKAITKVFVGTTWQRCTFHFLSNITDQLPRKNSIQEKQMIRDILTAPTQQAARERKDTFFTYIQDKPKFMRLRNSR